MCKDVYVCARTAIALLRPAVRNVAVKPGTVACFRNCVKRNTRLCACVVAQHIPNVIRPIQMTSSCTRSIVGLHEFHQFSRTGQLHIVSRQVSVATY